MPNGDMHPLDEGFDRAVDQAAQELAQSVARGMARRPLAVLVCTLTWMLSLPVQAFTNLCGN